MKHVLLAFSLLAVGCLQQQPVVAQVIFKETFGQTITRQTSPYMPANSYGWGDPNGALADEQEVENNYYAVIAPDHIRDAWPVPAWWFWSGPEPIGNTAGGAGNPATTDHTGDLNGAVMVVNAGTTLNGFYSRLANLTPGNSYRLSFWMYLVNASSTISMEVRDPLNGSVLGSLNTAFVSTTGLWQQYAFDFNIPAGCTSGGQVRVYLANAYSALSGNDYYVDDIQLEQLVGTTGTVITCPSGFTLPLNRISLSTQLKNEGIQVSWTADDVSDATAFAAQRSTDGKNFQTIYSESLPAGSAKTSYSFTDIAAPEGKVYYRVAGQKRSGAIVYSTTVTVDNLAQHTPLRVYPSPAKRGEGVSVQVKDAGISSCILYNIVGIPLRSYVAYPGQTFRIDGLSSGQYLLKSIDQKGNFLSVARFVIE